MEAIECIETRRSIRRFTDKEVSEETIKKIAKAAVYAPSWKNSQTVRYVVIKNKDLKDFIASNCLNGFEWNKNIIDSANALVVELTIDNISGYESDKRPTTNKGSHWQSFDAGLYAQTFCLAAHDLGLGTVIMGLFNESAIKQKLEIDEKYSISALIALGYPAQDPSTPNKVAMDDFLKIV